jgi:hypothetical protein
MEKNIPYHQLNRTVQIVGSLGIPLGKVIKVEGIALNPGEIREKAFAGKTLLKVLTVNGKKLKNPVTIVWQTLSFVNLNPPKPGQTVTYFGYETGEMRGIPEEAFRHIPYATTQGYHFATYFVALKEAGE